MNTAVAFLVFNRPDTTARVFAAIRDARPPKLLIVADGPRAERPGEAEVCAQVRAIAEGVDWPCAVLTCYADTNMGCKKRVASGLNWVFEQVEEAIILEDDCLPHPSFFRFCEEMLARFRDDRRVFMVSGDSFQSFVRDGRCDANGYYFSRYVHIWGWATWRRAWQSYDVDMKAWGDLRGTGWLRRMLGRRRAARHWAREFENTHAGRTDTWDFQWMLTCWVQNGLSVNPNVNLVSNIGFGEGATHTASFRKDAALPISGVQFPLQHLSYLTPDLRVEPAWDAINSADVLTRAVNKLRTLARAKSGKTS